MSEDVHGARPPISVVLVGSDDDDASTHLPTASTCLTICLACPAACVEDDSWMGRLIGCCSQ